MFLRSYAVFALFAFQAHAACRIDLVASLPLTLWQQKLFVPVTIGGTNALFLIDTGAGVTTLSKGLADRLMLPRDYDGTADMFGVGGAESHLTIAHAGDLALGGVHVAGQAFPVAVFDQAMADGSAVGGLIGADILSRFDLDLDIRNRRLDLWHVTDCSEVTPRWSGDWASAAMQVAPSRHISVPVEVDGAKLDLLVDTGAPSLVLSSRAAARAGATPEVLEQNRLMTGHGVNDRAFSGWVHIFARVALAGEIFGDVRTVVVAPGRGQTGEGLLGLEFLKRARVWLSYSTAKLYLQKTPL